MQNLIMVTQKVHDPNDQIFVFFAEEEALGVKPIRVYCQRMKEHNVSRAIIIVEKKLTPHAKTAVAEMGGEYEVEHFKASELLIDITEHCLVPK